MSEQLLRELNAVIHAPPSQQEALRRKAYYTYIVWRYGTPLGVFTWERVGEKWTIVDFTPCMPNLGDEPRNRWEDEAVRKKMLTAKRTVKSAQEKEPFDQRAALVQSQNTRPPGAK